MEVTANLEADVDPQALFEIVSDLGTYPSWLDIVGRAVGENLEDGAPVVWSIDLVGQLGPLRRSKRLRMRRTEFDPPDATSPGRVRFERDERDERHHSAWRLDVELTPLSGGPARSALDMRLHYGGSLWVPMLDRVLRDEIERSRSRLVAVAVERSSR